MAHPTKKICVRAPETTMYDLNDDVLREVFGQMDMKELIVAADVCFTFRRIARKEVASRHGAVVLDANWWRLFSGIEFGKHSVRVAPKRWNSILRRFDNVLTSLDISCGLLDDLYKPQLKLIDNYCGESLMELRLSGSMFTNEKIPEWRPIFARLRKLELRRCKFSSDFDASQLLSFCVELRSLSITEVTSLTFKSSVAMPQLKFLKWVDRKKQPIDVMEHLIALNPQLKEISCTPLHYEMIRMIQTHVPNIEKLEFVYLGWRIKEWGEFKNLKSIWIGGEYDRRTGLEMVPLEIIARAAVPIEELVLIGFYSIQELVETISKFKQLRTLYLDRGNGHLELSELLTIVQSLPSLGQLTVHDVPAKYIPDVIKNGPKLQDLTLLYPSGCVYDIQFTKIRNAVINYSKNRPLRLMVDKDHWHVSGKRLTANADILEIKPVDQRQYVTFPDSI